MLNHISLLYILTSLITLFVEHKDQNLSKDVKGCLLLFFGILRHADVAKEHPPVERATLSSKSPYFPANFF